MKTHPAIARLLANRRNPAAYQKVLHDADQADKAERCYQGPGRQTRGSVIDSMHADLIKADAAKINGMAADLWLLRALRTLERVS